MKLTAQNYVQPCVGYFGFSAVYKYTFILPAGEWTVEFHVGSVVGLRLTVADAFEVAAPFHRNQVHALFCITHGT